MTDSNHQHALPSHAERPFVDVADEDPKASAMELEGGDRAANLFGNQHIELSDEDVSSAISLCIRSDT